MADLQTGGYVERASLSRRAASLYAYAGVARVGRRDNQLFDTHVLAKSFPCFQFFSFCELVGSIKGGNGRAFPWPGKRAESLGKKEISRVEICFFSCMIVKSTTSCCCLLSGGSEILAVEAR